jgi:hypothetical protein
MGRLPEDLPDDRGLSVVASGQRRSIRPPASHEAAMCCQVAAGRVVVKESKQSVASLFG